MFSKFFLICMIKDKNLAESLANLAENLKTSNVAEFIEYAFYNSASIDIVYPVSG